MSEGSPQQIGRYEIRGILGRGAMGVVYSGWDPVIGRAVAVKVLSSGGSADDDQQRKWALREARAAGVLSHPNIVTVHDCGEENGATYIVMELVEGENLAERLERHGSLEPGAAAEVLAAVASALDHAHQQGILHRDVKPANIFLSDKGTVKIGDFGVARIETGPRMTRTGTSPGTPQYMSPEQLQAQPLNGRSDQFSLAVVGYEILTGTPPFSGNSLLVQILMKDPPSVIETKPRFRPAMDTVFRKALAKRPEGRYPSCAEFVGALRITMPSGSARRSQGGHPYRWLAAAIGLAAVALVGYAVTLVRTATPVVSPPNQAAIPSPPAETSLPESKVATEPERKKLPPTAATETAVAAPVSQPAAAPVFLRTGTIVWTGQLGPTEELTINGASVSAGQITRGLPGDPVEIRVTPRDIDVLESPSAENGWKRLRLRTPRDTDSIIVTYQRKE